VEVISSRNVIEEHHEKTNERLASNIGSLDEAEVQFRVHAFYHSFHNWIYHYGTRLNLAPNTFFEVPLRYSWSVHKCSRYNSEGNFFLTIEALQGCHVG